MTNCVNFSFFIAFQFFLLCRFERALQAIDVSVSLPYWDSSTDGHLGDQAADSIMWTDTFAGRLSTTIIGRVVTLYI